MTTAPTDRIETTPCGRCGGSGKYSFNQINGSRCFGCGGVGKVDTARGAAARAFLQDMRSKPADQFAVDELVQHDIASPYATAKVWSKVQAIEMVEQKITVNGDATIVPMVTLTLAGKAGTTRYTVGRATMMRQGFDADTKQAQLREALAFQATLDKQGRALRAFA